MTTPTPDQAREAVDKLVVYANNGWGSACPGEVDTLRRFIDAHSAPANENYWTEVALWAEIHRLRAAVKGPEGYDSWQDAATAERIRRVKVEAAQPKREPLTDAQIDAAWSAMGSFTERRADNRLFARAIERLITERMSAGETK